MISFDKWMREPKIVTKYEEKWYESNEEEILELLEYNNADTEITELEYPCNSCHELSEIYVMPNEFDSSMHYCGRSPRCCP